MPTKGRIVRLTVRRPSNNAWTASEKVLLGLALDGAAFCNDSRDRSRHGRDTITLLAFASGDVSDELGKRSRKDLRVVLAAHSKDETLCVGIPPAVACEAQKNRSVLGGQIGLADRVRDKR